MKNPFFSILIPTRQRHSTLAYAIQSVLFQKFEDFELVVMDNCSGTETEAVVRQYRSPKLFYHRSPRVLPMNENWETGLSLCQGEYVYVMGDDDGLMPDGLTLASQILRRGEFDVLGWQKYTYWWDDAIEESLQGRLFLHLGHNFQVLDNSSVLKAYYDWQVGMGALPSIYTGLVRRQLIDRIRARHGQYFPLGAPDVYTGIANLYYGGRVGWFERGLSVAGNSGFSTGTSWFFRSKGKHRRDAYHSDEGKDETELMHPALLPSVNLEVNLADTQLRAKQMLFPEDDRYQVKIPVVLAAMAANANRDPASYDEVIAEVQALARKYGIDPGAVAVPERSREPRRPMQGPLLDGQQRVQTLAVNCRVAGFHDVAQAARLAQALLPELHIQ